MGLDPRIALATTVPDLGRTFSNILTNIASLDTIRENRETAPLRLQALKDVEAQRSSQSQLTQEQILQTKLANTSNRDKQRIASIAPFATSIIPDLQAGNYEAVKQQVIHRQNFLQNQIDQGMLVDRTETDQLMEVLNTNPSQALPIVQAAANIGKMLQTKSAGQRQFESLISDFTPDQQRDARLTAAGLKGRATGAAPQIVDIGGVPHVFNKQTGKLAPVEVEGKKVTPGTVGESESTIISAKENAKEAVKRKFKDAENKKSRGLAWDVYSTGIKTLTDAFSNTDTGPFAGLLPAWTANQQMAEGGVALMAPILKQMFRAAGEGVFTDKDQELLMGMLPSRSDHESVVRAKLAAVDSVVMAKLGITDFGQQSQQPQSVDLTAISDEDLLKLKAQQGQ